MSILEVKHDLVARQGGNPQMSEAGRWSQSKHKFTIIPKGKEFIVRLKVKFADQLKSRASQSQILTSRPFFSKWRKIWI